MRGRSARRRFVVGAFALAVASAPLPIAAQEGTPAAAAPAAAAPERPPPARPPSDWGRYLGPILNRFTQGGQAQPAPPPSQPCPRGQVRTRYGCQWQAGSGGFRPAPAVPAPAASAPATPARPPTRGTDPFAADQPLDPPRPAPTYRVSHAPKPPAKPAAPVSVQPAPAPAASAPTQPPTSAPPAAVAARQPPGPQIDVGRAAAALAALLIAAVAGALTAAKLLTATPLSLQLRPAPSVLRTRFRFTRRRRGGLVAVRAVPDAIDITSHAMGRPT